MTAVSSPVNESKAFARASCSLAGSSRTFCMARSNNFVMIYPNHRGYVEQRLAVVSEPMFRCSSYRPRASLRSCVLRYRGLLRSHFIEHGVDLAALEAVTGCGGERVECRRDVVARAPARPEQRAAFLRGKAIAVDQHEIDIGRARGNAFRQQQGRFVDHGRQRPPLDLLWGEGAPRDALGFSALVDHRMHLRIDAPAPRAVGI